MYRVHWGAKRLFFTYTAELQEPFSQDIIIISVSLTIWQYNAFLKIHWNQAAQMTSFRCQNNNLVAWLDSNTIISRNLYI